MERMMELFWNLIALGAKYGESILEEIKKSLWKTLELVQTQFLLLDKRTPLLLLLEVWMLLF